MADLRFTLEQAQAAFDEWSFNCGTGSLCAVLGMTPDEIRPHLLDFEKKGYTNPTLMKSILTGLKVKWRQTYRSDDPKGQPVYPAKALVRVQWGGPWTAEGVPMAARYRHTHWIAVRPVASMDPHPPAVFDVNAMGYGGWLPFHEWTDQLVPWLLKECEPKADGSWWPTHILEVLP